MTSGSIVFSSITIRRLVKGVKWNSVDYSEILASISTTCIVCPCQLFLSYSAG